MTTRCTRALLPALLLALLWGSAAPSPAAAAAGSDTPTTPNDKLAFWDQQRRGANGEGGSDPEAWFEAAAQAGIEYVRLTPATWQGVGRDFLLGSADRFDGIPPEDLAKLIAVLDVAERRGVKVVLTMFSLPGARWRQQNEGEFDYRLWNEERFQAQAVAFWRELAANLRSHPAVVAYDPLNEPHPARQYDLEGSSPAFDEWLARNEGGPADVNAFNARVVEAIRQVDSVTPILLEGWFYASSEGLAHLRPIEDPAVLYSFHFYEPWTFTTFRVNAGRFAFPARMPEGDSEETVAWPSDAFVQRLEPVAAWAERFGVAADRIVASEFGCDRRVPGAREYLAGLVAELEARGWHWAFYSFRSPDWDGLDYELGTQPLGREYWQAREGGADHESLIERHDNPLWAVLQRKLAARGRSGAADPTE
jgi:endoglucanase